MSDVEKFGDGCMARASHIAKEKGEIMTRGTRIFHEINLSILDDCLWKMDESLSMFSFS